MTLSARLSIPLRERPHRIVVMRRMRSADTTKAILWDNDGVLVDTEHIYFDATRSVLAEAGIGIGENEYREYFLKQSGGAWHLALESGYSLEDVEAMRARRSARYAEALRTKSVAIDGVRTVLESLKPHFRMAVVTSSRRHHFDIIHEKTGFMSFFEFALVREDYGRSKPDPEPYLTAVSRLGLNTADCLVIEDTERGLRAAASAGIRCWIIPKGLSEGSDFSAAERVLRDIREVPALLVSSGESGR